MNKTIFHLSAVLMLSFMLACEGPEGPKGSTGPIGPVGPTGQNGNEEVYLFTYGSKLLDAASYYSVDYTFDTLSASTIDKSLILIYYSMYSEEWNMANGSGPNGMFQSIQYYSSYDSTAHVYLKNIDGSAYSGSDITWDSSKVYVIPPAMIRLAEEQKVDFFDIHQVQKLTGLK